MTRMLRKAHGAYHREIGREATALFLLIRPADRAYHREIGREATATM